MCVQPLVFKESFTWPWSK